MAKLVVIEPFSGMLRNVTKLDMTCYKKIFLWNTKSIHKTNVYVVNLTVTGDRNSTLQGCSVLVTKGDLLWQLQ